MNARWASRFLYRLLRKSTRIQTRLVKETLILQNRLMNDSDVGRLTIPLCVTTGFNNIYWSRSWKTTVIDKLEQKDAGVFVDVGANVGQTLLDLLDVRPTSQWFGFEPNVACANYLKELISANSLDQCLVIPVGLTTEAQCLPLYRGKGLVEDSGATIVPNLRPEKLNDVDLVPCFRFDDIAQSLGVTRITFVKIDVEGSELGVLLGMRKHLKEFRPPILCEVLFTDINADLSGHREINAKLMQFLDELDYAVVQLVRSPDQAHIIDAKEIESFVAAYWTEENKNLCDYVFLPKERKVHLLDALLSMN